MNLFIWPSLNYKTVFIDSKYFVVGSVTIYFGRAC